MPSFEAKALLAAVLNSPTYGAGVRLAPDAAVDDGLLHVVLIEAISKLGVLTLLPRLMGSGELRTARLKRWLAKRVKLTTNRPCLFHGDGEILGPTPVELEVAQQCGCWRQYCGRNTTLETWVALWRVLVKHFAADEAAQISEFEGANLDSPRKSRCNQTFFRSIFRFRSISLRLSKLEIVRVVDLAPSFSACTS